MGFHRQSFFYLIASACDLDGPIFHADACAYEHSIAFPPFRLVSILKRIFDAYTTVAATVSPLLDMA